MGKSKSEEIAIASECAVEEVIAHIKEILGDSYRFEGIHIQVSNKEGRMMNFTLNDERVKDILFVLSKQVLSLASDLIRDDLYPLKTVNPEPYKPSTLTEQTNTGLASSDLHKIEQRIMARVEKQITAAVTSIQINRDQEINPRDYNKHLFGTTP